MKPILITLLLISAAMAHDGPTPAQSHIALMRADGSLTNVVNSLVADGTVCAIRGQHIWAAGCYMSGCLVYHGDGPMRHCELCHKLEYMTWSSYQQVHGTITFPAGPSFTNIVLTNLPITSFLYFDSNRVWTNFTNIIVAPK